MEWDVIGTKKLFHQLAKSYRKGQQQRPFTIKIKDSDEIIRATEDTRGPWQHGFRKGVGTCDMIFALRQLIEKHWEFNQPLNVAFLNLEKAFGRIPKVNYGRH